MQHLQQLKLAMPTRTLSVSRSSSLTNLALLSIRRQIVEGELALGEALSESALARALGVSKTPVREALLHLKREGLVQIYPQHGTFVFEVTTELVNDLCDFRKTLELSALERAMTRHWGQLVDALEVCVQRMEDAVIHEDMAAYRTIDAEFHAALFDLSDNSFLREAYAGVEFRIQALRTRLSVKHQNNRETLTEHRKIASLIVERNFTAAAQELSSHISHTEKSYLQLTVNPGGLTTKKTGTR